MEQFPRSRLAGRGQSAALVLAPLAPVHEQLAAYPWVVPMSLVRDAAMVGDLAARIADERSRADAEDFQPLAGSLGQAHAFLESPTPLRDRLAKICSGRSVPTAAPRAAQSALGADARNLADREDGWAWVRTGSN